jgi:hypothetical protein
MKPIEKLALYSQILPSAEALEKDNPDGYFALKLQEILVGQREIFDCRKLPYEFVVDAGAAAYAEIEQTKQMVRLPFQCCYFEFNDLCIFASEGTTWHPHSDDPVVDFFQVPILERGACRLERGDFLGASFLQFRNGVRFPEGEHEPPIINIVNDEGPADGVALDLQSYSLLGVLTLLNERLLIDLVEPDPAKKLNSARAKRGKFPVSGARHLLTVNVPAVRRVARRTPIGTHESPALHWRRGHWRLNHRGSEFEKNTWVRKCLVGDPNKGFVGKSYRLVHDVPMIKSTEPSIPELLGA